MEGLLSAWNRAHPGNEVVAYDRIYAVNGKTREMQQELRKNQTVSLRVVRYPQMFAVELRVDAKEGPKPIGLRIQRQSGVSELRIEEVLSYGAMEDFNQAQIRHARVPRWAGGENVGKDADAGRART
eukprot:g18010.t1